MNDSSSAVLDQIMTELNSPGFEELPEETIRLAREHREAIIPRLIEAIERATERSRKGEYVEENGHFYGVFLLTEFEAKEALPAIVESMLLPEDMTYDLYGDTLTEYFSACLAALCDPPFDEIERILSCEDADHYVRWVAGSAYLFLVRDGRMTRDEAVQRLLHHLTVALENQSFPLVEFLVSELCDYSPTEAEAEIRQAFAYEQFNTSTVSFNEFEESLEGGDAYIQKHLERCRPTGIADSIQCLAPWFSSHRIEINEEDDDYPEFSHYFPNIFRDDPKERNDHDTIRNLEPKIGRNDPCSCGSGKKYKKCCGKK